MGKRSKPGAKESAAYEHEEQAVLRPEIGTQAQFKKKRPPRQYRYDSSLSPALEWDGQNPARELGEWLIAQIEQAAALPPPHIFDQPRFNGDRRITGLADAVAELRKLSRPFVNWAGKAERLSFEVPTLPLFVHERLSTKAILETLKAHERDRQMELQLFRDPQLSLAQQLQAYEHTAGWVNRLILGDSLVVMTSLMEYEGLGGKVQMIYMDPPYGVKYGSNFQPFVRRRDVTHGDDDSMTREPEMVKAYRDTWELGLHSYLTYLRDRLLVARELLAPSGSIFVQISDENVHVVRALLDEVFDRENALSTIVFQKTGSEEGEGVSNLADYLLWYARDRARLKAFSVLREKRPGEPGARQYTKAQSRKTGEFRDLTVAELAQPELIGDEWRVCYRGFPLTSQDPSPTRTVPFLFDGKEYWPGGSRRNRHWSLDPQAAMPRLVEQGRIYATRDSIRAVVYLDELPGSEIGNVWLDTGTGSFTEEQLYVVQTSEKVVERCILMTTEAGDLVLDPTCGSGTTAYAAEKWGRRWVTIDTSRVPLALTRQRMLTSTFPFFRLLESERGPGGGLEYQDADRTKNRKADGYGIHAQHTLSSIAGEERPTDIVFRDRPEIDYSVTRVCGPFCVEATIPTPINDDDSVVGDEPGAAQSSRERLLDALRRNPVLKLMGNRSITLRNIRAPAASLTISAEAALEPSGAPIALIFGPENGAVSEKLVYEGAREAHARSYERLIVIGFAIETGARQLVDQCSELVGLPASYVQATPDLAMGDLLKTMRSSQIFSVTGLPDVVVKRLSGSARAEPEQYQVELRGLDVFDPTTMTTHHGTGGDVPAWLLDTDYNDLCFLVSQAFFPRTAAWDHLKRELRASFEDTVWEHLSGITSAPFVPGKSRKIAVKVIDDRGNELLVVKNLDQAE